MHICRIANHRCLVYKHFQHKHQLVSILLYFPDHVNKVTYLFKISAFI